MDEEIEEMKRLLWWLEEIAGKIRDKHDTEHLEQGVILCNKLKVISAETGDRLAVKLEKLRVYLGV